MRLFLFTIYYPYTGGEQFLSSEVPFLLERFGKMYVYTMVKTNGESKYNKNEILVGNFNFHGQVRVKGLLKKHWRLILVWWLREFIVSPHRLKYIREFKWNWNRFIGLVDTADRLYDLLRNECDDNDVFYSYWLNEWATVLVLAREMGLKGKIVARAHGYDFDESQQSRGYHPFRYVELCKINKVFQVSGYGKNYMEKRHKKHGPIVLSRLGVDSHEIAPLAEGWKYQLVSCSNLVPLKRVTLIADLLSKLNVSFFWRHFGDGKEMIYTKEYVAEILKPGSYEFMGNRSNSYIMEFYKNNGVDLFLNASVLEGIPFSMMEAISFGIPILGCNTCGVPEIVCDETGILIDKYPDITHESYRIEDFLKNKSRNLEYRKGVRGFCERHFNSELNYRKHLSEIKEI